MRPGSLTGAGTWGIEGRKGPAGMAGNGMGSMGKGADMMEKISGMIFDMDDTIARTEELNVELIFGYFKEAWKLDLDGEDRATVFGHSWRIIYEKLIAKYGLPLTIFDVQNAVVERKGRHLETHRLDMAQGVERIVELPIQKVIVSGSGRAEIEMIMKHCGLDGHFAAYFSADEITSSKPSPEGFLKALEYLGTPPAETLVFEDSKSGVEAAHRAGLPCVFMREFAQGDHSHLADYSFNDFNEFYLAFEAVLQLSTGH